MHYLNDINIIRFKEVSSKEASLFVYEGHNDVPFDIKRSFIIKSYESCDRGEHAHKKCTQLLVALEGKCTVTCDDGKTKKQIVLDNPSQGLLIPSGIWAGQKYEPLTILMVLTDMLYDEDDYLRNYQQFLNFRETL